MSPSRLKLLAELEQFKNLYYVNRTETDIATLAGLEAAEAILSGDRSHLIGESIPLSWASGANPRLSNSNCRFQSIKFSTILHPHSRATASGGSDLHNSRTKAGYVIL